MLSSPSWNLKGAHGYCEREKNKNKNSLSWTFLFFHYGTHFYSVLHAISKGVVLMAGQSHSPSFSSKVQDIKTEQMTSHRTEIALCPYDFVSTWQMEGIRLGKLNFDKHLCRALQILIQLSHLWNWYYYNPHLWDRWASNRLMQNPRAGIWWNWGPNSVWLQS